MSAYMDQDACIPLNGERGSFLYTWHENVESSVHSCAAYLLTPGNTSQRRFCTLYGAYCTRESYDLKSGHPGNHGVVDSCETATIEPERDLRQSKNRFC